MFVSKSLLVLVLAVCALAGNIPHERSDVLRHRALAVRGNASAPNDLAVNPLRKRALTKRCTAPSSDLLNSATTSSANAVPASPTPEPAPTTTKAPPPATTSASNEPSFMQGTQTGQGTYFTGPGACGGVSDDSTYVAAVSHSLFDAYPGYNDGDPASNPVCFKKVEAHYQGKSVTVSIIDRCTNCSVTDLDFSPAAFLQLADLSVGRLFGMTWDWLD
ncbi:hypothetical protein OBBRIDRAFT_502778 [Obba rivulosa]|uniref:RlpA-like protein double-psi beta-barrel domain-containing protein n=1 Tax=Obba rivulosa TaxID=1052685 RepID=A0A8E2DTZ2_9APHY|nr:hypothetical protein OBBRIDRAFT_502778 [Obba rivulosa]